MKAFVLCAGALGSSILAFVAVFLLARVIRYCALAYLGSQMGDQAMVYLRHNVWNLVAFAVGLFVVLYLMPGFQGRRELMSKLGKHKTGKSCLYIQRLEDVHLPTLKTLIRESVNYLDKMVRERAAAAKNAKSKRS